MIFTVSHRTKVTYSAPVAQAQFNLRLLPWGWRGQVLRATHLSVNPEPQKRSEKRGPYCVNTTQIVFGKELQMLEILSEFEVDIEPPPLPDDGPELALVTGQALAERSLAANSPAPYLFASRIAGVQSDIGQWGGQYLSQGGGIVAAASRLMAAIYHDFAYVPGSTNSATSPAEAFAVRQGVCQDFAHVMIVALRSKGIPAAYVSGYLRTVPPPGQERLVGADAMHAWVNVWCGHELGWIGFDPTNNCLARSDHILIAMGRDYADVAPIDGTFLGSAPQSMTTAVDVLAIG